MSLRWPSLAFVDLETTGGNATSDRITEIGIVTVNGSEVSQWSNLVNPGMPIPPWISGLTGITDAMVASAPSFAEVAYALKERLSDCLFIAHNARFDHGFLKNEFRRLGIDFKPTVLCTVKLSRRLYPGFGHHNLDALIERHRLDPSQRHRALGDAQLIWQFWQKIALDHSPEVIEATIHKLTARPSLPSHLQVDLVDDIPSSHGVYFFYGKNHLPLYIGKANDLRRRILSHFSSDHRSERELELSQQIERIDWIQTSGEIGALLKEAELIKRHRPLYNIQLRQTEVLYAWRLTERQGQCRITLGQSDDLFFDQDCHLYGLFTSPRQAQSTLRAVVDEHALCAVCLGLEKGRSGKPCFAYQVKRCLGACTGVESAQSHGARLKHALAPWQLSLWPYHGPIGIREGPMMHLIDRWQYLGSAQSEEEITALLEPQRTHFDRDVYRILKPRLSRLASRLVSFARYT